MTPEQKLSAEDIVFLDCVRDGTWEMRRGLTIAWLRDMRARKLIRLRRACEANRWQADHVLTKAGEKAIASAAASRKGSL